MSTKADNHDHEKTTRAAFGHRPAARVLPRAILLGGEKREGGGLTPSKCGSATDDEARDDWSIFRPTGAQSPTPQWVVSKTHWPRPIKKPYTEEGGERHHQDERGEERPEGTPPA